MAVLVEKMGKMEGEGTLDELLNSWARSPSARVLRPDEEDGLGPTPEPDALGDFSLDDLLMAPSPLGKLGGGGGASAPAAAAGLQQQQQQQQQQAGGSGHALPYLVLPNVNDGMTNGGLPNGGLPNGSMPLDLPPLMGAAQQQQLAAAVAASQQPNGSPFLHPPALGGLQPVGSVLSNMAVSSQQLSASEGGEGQPSKKRRGPRPRLFKKHACQCDGCTVDLASLSFYLQRNHICPDHLKADSYMVKGVPSRFCQRCGQGHPLTEFEGSKRSCRKALERHNQRRRDKQAVSTATGTSNPSASALGPGASSEVQMQLQLQAAQQAAAMAAQQQLQQQQDDAMLKGWLDSTFDDVQGPFQQAQHAQPQQEQQQQLEQQQGQSGSLPTRLSSGLPNGLALAPTGLEATGSVTLPPTWQPRPSPLGPSPLGRPPAEAAVQGDARLVAAAAQQAQQQQQQAAQALQPVPKEEQWVMLPRHLLEQHAPHLLASAMMLSDGGALQELPQQQPLQPVHQQQQQQQQQQQPQPQPQPALLPPRPPQQAQQAQQADPEQLLWPPKPDASAYDLLDEPFNLLFGEFGGSGI